MPLRSRPEPETRLCLDELISHGAAFVSSSQITDIPKHRNLLAAKVLRQLEPLGRQTIVWLDSDQVVSPLAVAILAYLAQMVRGPVSGCYVLRAGAEPTPLAAAAIDVDPICVLLPGPPLILPQVYCGMGCLAVPRTCFEEHAKKSVWIDEPNVMPFPVLCWSGPVPNEHAPTGYSWAPEDFCYSELHSVATGKLPLLAPVSVGHLRDDEAGRRILWPTRDSLLIGAKREIPWGPDGRLCELPAVPST